MVTDSATTLRVNFAQVLNVEPAPISCMSLNDHNHGKLQLALFRGGNVGAIELWDVTHQPYLEKVLLDVEQIDGKASVESLIWVAGRLFSCGLHGFVVEHNVFTGKMKSKIAATSGPVWSIRANPKGTLLAAGTEDGFVNIFEIEGNCLLYQRVLDRQDGRVICLDWSPCGQHIVTGSIDCLRLWDVEKGHAVQRLVTGRSKNKETIVWSVLLLEELTIVSGDSRGFVSFWDGRVGVLKFKIQTHKADILSIRLATDKVNIYAAGVDPIVVLVSKVGHTDKWVKSHQRNMHLNDVMSLETHGNRLFSGGVDADLTVSSFPPKIVTKYPPFNRRPFVVTSKPLQKILTQQAKSISLWSLPTSDTELVKILDVESKSQETIYSICMNQSGSVFGYSTVNNIRFFHVTQDPTLSKAPKLSKLRIVNSNDQDSFENMFVQLQFLTEDALIMITPDGQASILKVDIETGSITRQETFFVENGDDLKRTEASLQAISQDGKHVCVSMNGTLSIYTVNFEKFNISKRSSIPVHSACATSVSFHPLEPFVLITYSDHLLHVFDYEACRIVLYQRIKKNLDDLYPIVGSAWSPTGHRAVLYQADSIQLLEIEQEERPKAKKQKRDSSRDEKYSFKVKSCAKHKYVAYAGFYDEVEDLIVVEVHPNSLLEKLPPSFMKKRFGN